MQKAMEQNQMMADMNIPNNASPQAVIIENSMGGMGSPMNMNYGPSNVNYGPNNMYGNQPDYNQMNQYNMGAPAQYGQPMPYDNALFMPQNPHQYPAQNGPIHIN